jgi:activator of 2-hydroxyglutaryl-CoA dehydratase
MSEHEYASVNEQLDWKKAKAIVAGVDVGAVSSKVVILLDGQPYAVSQVAARTPKESASGAINALLARTNFKVENISTTCGDGPREDFGSLCT